MFSHQLLKDYRSPLLEPVFFLRWWYGRATLNVLFFGLFLVAGVEDRFSFIVMLKQVLTLQPLHQDYSIVGRGIGVVIRLLWILIGAVVMAAAVISALSLIGVWLGLPLLLVYGLLRYYL